MRRDSSFVRATTRGTTASATRRDGARRAMGTDLRRGHGSGVGASESRADARVWGLVPGGFWMGCDSNRSKRLLGAAQGICEITLCHGGSCEGLAAFLGSTRWLIGCMVVMLCCRLKDERCDTALAIVRRERIFKHQLYREIDQSTAWRAESVHRRFLIGLAR